jgi:hypothetical protein
MIVGWPPANASTAVAAAVAAAPSRAPQGRGSCTYYLEKYCKADAGKNATCLTCLKAPDHAVLKRGLCTAAEASNFCRSGHLPPAPPRVPRGVAWAHQLPPLGPSDLVGCSAGVTKSTGHPSRAHSLTYCSEGDTRASTVGNLSDRRSSSVSSMQTTAAPGLRRGSSR